MSEWCVGWYCEVISPEYANLELGNRALRMSAKRVHDQGIYAHYSQFLLVNESPFRKRTN